MFRVRWEQRALIELANLWTQTDSDQRRAITAATHVSDQRLRSDPLHEGESRSKGRRIAFFPPLAVTFHVDVQSQIVSVLQIRKIRRRR